MIPIKFRGKSIKTGKYVCGGYFCNQIKKAHYIVVYDELLGKWIGVEVFPPTLKRLCGYDAYGFEVYDGDKVAAESTDPAENEETRFEGTVYCDTLVDVGRFFQPRFDSTEYRFRKVY